MRDIQYIVVHCTATQPDTKVDTILKNWKAIGWKNPGYHHLIDATGVVHDLLPEDKVSNGVKGYNAISVHVCYIGGIDPKGKPKDTRTEAQKASLLSVIKAMRQRYPSAKIQGHRDFGVNKACPSFNAKTEYAGI